MARPLLLLVDDVPEIGMIVQRLGKWAEQDVVHCLDAETAWKRVTSGEYPPDQYLYACREWVSMGAQVVGGCCGTTPMHIEALKIGLPKTSSV